MKANLLLQALHQGKSAGTVKKEELPPMLVRFSEKTYPYPVTGCTNRAALTRAAAMMVWGLLAYMGPVVLGSVLAAYILVRIAPVVVRAVFTEEPPPSPSHASLAPPTETPAVTPVGTSKKAVQLAEYTKMRNDFLVVEEYLIRRLPTLNALLSLVLELFGVLWTLCIVTPLLIYAVPGVGRPWGFAALCGNFVNDIAALLIGKTLRYLREIILVNTGNGGAAPSGLYQFILNFPHPLCPRVSPNKSLEGAIAGVLANSVSFYLL
ncbi:hypothetical protein AGDE_10339 [Angomonas deanei]|nr:hypothetical protein AGDE_10339 [Angomonas deanei]|eukprot:EPY28674.1 hypothetical protein AGDE_10339 [Angomonas deanei]